MKESIVSDPPESAGQYMLHYQLQEILPLQLSIAGLARAAVDIPEGDDSIIVRQCYFHLSRPDINNEKGISEQKSLSRPLCNLQPILSDHTSGI